MSNPLFENPKVALGFAGVVVAIAMVASVALQEFSPSDEAALPAEPVQQAQSASQPAAGGVASTAASGWAGDSGASDDWGAASVSEPQGGGFGQPSEMTNDAPVFGDHVSKSVSGGGYDGSSGPKITSSAAPGAPEVRPPETGFTPDIKVKGN